jgi:WD40 repeat protein
MHALIKLFFLLLTLAAATSSVCRAGGTDANGDLLPKFAIARLGTERLYQPSVHHMLFGPDGKVIAAMGSFNRAGVVRLWDTATGKRIREWKVAQPRGYSPADMPMAFSGDGRFLAVGSYDGTLHVWDTVTGAQVVYAAAKALRAVAFGADGRSLATLTQSGTQVYELPGGKLRYERVAGAYPAFLAYSRDGKRLVTVGYDARDRRDVSIRRWDVATGTPQPTVSIAHFSNFAGRLSPDGETLALPESRPIGSREPVRVRQWDTTSGKELESLEGMADSPAQLAFALDSSRLTAMSAQGRLRVWDNKTGKLLHDFDGRVGSIEKVALNTDGTALAAIAHDDEAIHLWELASGKELHRFGGHRSGPLSVVFTADGRFVLSTSRENGFSVPSKAGRPWSLRRWVAEAGKETTISEFRPNSEVTLTAFSADGLLAATAETDGRLRIYDTHTCRERCSGRLPTRTTTVKSGTEVRRYDQLNAHQLVFAPNGKTVAADSLAGAIGFWDTVTGKLMHEIKIPEGPVRFALAPDGKSVLVSQWQIGAVGPGNSRHSLLQKDISTGNTIRTFGEVKDWGSVAISADNSTAASLSRARLSVCDMATGTERWSSEVPEWSATLAFAPDSRLLATGGRDGIVRLWNSISGKQVHELAGHDSEVSSLAWSPDSRRLVSAADNVAIVWNVASISK